MANTENNTHQRALIDPPPTSKPLSCSFATVAQLLAAFPFLSGEVDETFLRNRAREINPRTGAPWIPKPRNNQFDINPTLIGLLEWFVAKADAHDGIPAYYDSMAALQDSPLGIPKEFTRWALENGCGKARLGGSRIDPLPILAKLNEIAKLIPSGGIDGLAEYDKDTELAKKLEQDRFKGERENALADRRIFDLNEVERRCRLEILLPVRDGLQAMQKKFARLKKSNPGIAAEILAQDLPAMLEKISGEKPPARVNKPVRVNKPKAKSQ